MNGKWPGLDGWLTACLFLLGVLIGSTYVHAFDASGRRTPLDFGQYEFGAAVALACGHGFVDVSEASSPALAAFLQLKTDRVSCSELPAALPAAPPNFTQRLYRYLLSAVAFVWTIRGVSWSVLWPLFGIAYGATVALAYRIVRLASGPIGSAAVALALLASAIHLGNLPFLRDYAKAPFILGLILIIARAAASTGRRRALLAWSVTFGVVLGIGFGFRNDILIVIPPFLVAMFFWEPPRTLEAAGYRTACAAVAAMAFVVTAWPIISGYRGGSNTGHVALLGLMTMFDRPLGITGSVYGWGYVYLDRFVGTMMASHGWRDGGRIVGYLSPEYDRETIGYVLHIARHWPADVLARAYAAVLKIVEFPFTAGTYMSISPPAFTGNRSSSFYAMQQILLGLFRGAGVLFVAASLAFVSSRNVFRACLLLLALIYFAGYPAIQFHVRHFFHLEFIAWWAVVFVAEEVIRGGAEAWRLRRADTSWMPGARQAGIRVLTFAILTLAIVLVPIGAARAYQQPHVRSMLRRYDAAPRAPVSFERRDAGARTLLATDSLWSTRDPRAPVDAACIVAEFASSCGAVRLPVTFRYQAPDPTLDYSFDAVVPLGSGQSPSTIFFPAYDANGGSRFAGIEVPRGFEGCLTSLTRVADLRPFPMLLDLNLTPGWEQTALYQRLESWESEPVPQTADQRLETIPRTMPVRRSTLLADLELPRLAFRVPIVRDDSTSGWTIRGMPDGPHSGLIQLAAQQRTPDDRFVVEGQLNRGGIAIGLLTGQTWAGDTNALITTPGAFSVVLAPSKTGTYGVLFANALDDSWLVRNASYRVLKVAGWFHTFTDVRILRAGWVKRS